jgi:hypothetical protein
VSREEMCRERREIECRERGEIECRERDECRARNRVPRERWSSVERRDRTIETLLVCIYLEIAGNTCSFYGAAGRRRARHPQRSI